MRYVVERMTMADIPRIVEVERLAYTTPWPPSAYRKELEENQHAYYIVVRDTSLLQPIQEAEPVTQPAQARRPFPLSLLHGRTPTPGSPHLASIIGFAGLWLMLDEAHITTIATHPDYRGRGLGELLLCSMTKIAYDIGAERVTLEVRVSNA